MQFKKISFFIAISTFLVAHNMDIPKTKYYKQTARGPMHDWWQALARQIQDPKITDYLKNNPGEGNVLNFVEYRHKKNFELMERINKLKNMVDLLKSEAPNSPLENRNFFNKILSILDKAKDLKKEVPRKGSSLIQSTQEVWDLQDRALTRIMYDALKLLDRFAPYTEKKEDDFIVIEWKGADLTSEQGTQLSKDLESLQKDKHLLQSLLSTSPKTQSSLDTMLARR